MRTLIRDAALRNRLAGNARTWAARFSWEGIAAREKEWLDAESG
jgi:hypothetical protein